MDSTARMNPIRKVVVMVHFTNARLRTCRRSGCQKPTGSVLGPSDFSPSSASLDEAFPRLVSGWPLVPSSLLICAGERNARGNRIRDIADKRVDNSNQRAPMGDFKPEQMSKCQGTKSLFSLGNFMAAATAFILWGSSKESHLNGMKIYDVR